MFVKMFYFAFTFWFSLFTSAKLDPELHLVALGIQGQKYKHFRTQEVLIEM